MEEVWKDIKECEGLYKISTLGNIYSYIRAKNVNFIKSTKGYYKVRLHKNGIEKRRIVHLLVWEHFGIGERNGTKIVVDHIDENKLNNRIDNLQLLTNRQNIHKSKKLTNKVLPVGVSYCKRLDRFRARIWDGKKDTHIGYYETVEEANDNYQRKLQEVINGN